MLESVDSHDLYPIIVRQSRYSGIYEGGVWFAMGNFDESKISVEYFDYIFGDDCDAADFWCSEDSESIGRGDTPNDAVNDLLLRFNSESAREIKPKIIQTFLD
jgi:hypothetical protein